MNLTQILHSKEDKSVNFIFDNWLEARFVRRTKEYFIVYLSSHDGCNKACRFCHLTQTRQTSFNDTTIDEYMLQAQTVLEYYDSIVSEQGLAARVNFNFMARGEPLANKVILNEASKLFNELEKLAKLRNLDTLFNISSIFPEEMKNKELAEIFKNVTQNYGIYYSLYSVDEGFRKRWLPKALPYKLVLEKLQSWQNLQLKNTTLALHWAFIQGENDKDTDISQLKEVLSRYKLKTKFNLVRYNPYSLNQGIESDEITLQKNFDNINFYLNNAASRIVPRVGYDVKASCGMFVTQEEIQEM